MTAFDEIMIAVFLIGVFLLGVALGYNNKWHYFYYCDVDTTNIALVRARTVEEAHRILYDRFGRISTDDIRFVDLHCLEMIVLRSK